MSFTAGAGTRFLVTSTTNPSGGSTTLPGPLSITGGTATANAPVLNATQTWNNAAVTFTGWQLNVTDTASNAASLLMDLQVGGVSRFAVSKSSIVTATTFRVPENSGTIEMGGSGGSGTRFQTNGGDQIRAYYNGASTNALTSAGFVVDSNTAYIFTSGNVGSVQDLFIRRDAANTLAQRNGVNAQTLRVYNTFTDASNYERGGMSWSGNRLNLFTENAGTGLARTVGIGTSGSAPVNIFTNGTDRWQFRSSGTFVTLVDNAYDIGEETSSRPRNGFWAGYQQMSEMTAPAAPAANSVRIYAEDNGSGKTRLMALFATGAAQQIAIEP